MNKRDSFNPADSTLLIVDDEADIRDLLIDQLKPLGCKIIEAGSGPEALALIKARSSDDPIDAVLCDVSMPEVSGLELFEQCRALDFEAPFVFLTGYGHKSTVIKALRLGAFDFIEKPCDGQDLIKALRPALELGFSLRTLADEVEHVLKTMSDLEPSTDSALGEIRDKVRKMVRFKMMNRTVFKSGKAS